MSDPNDLAAFLDLGWESLERTFRARDPLARHPVLATVAPDGSPQARTVVLRALKRASATVEVHTDRDSEKVVALRHAPKAQMQIWDAPAQIQLRIDLRMEVITGAEAAQRWGDVPEPSRYSYGKRPAVGTPIARADAYDVTATVEYFTILRGQILRMDVLELAETHRRALYAPQDGWTGHWISP